MIIAAPNVGGEATGEGTAGYAAHRIDPGNPVAVGEEGNQNESPTQQPRSHRILGEDRTDPIIVNHYYLMYAAIVNSCKT